MIYKILFSILLSSTSIAKSPTTSSLQTMNYEQMTSIVRKHIAISQKLAIKSQAAGNEDAHKVAIVAELKKALLLIMARPNRDFMSTKLLPDLVKNLNQYDAYYPTLKSLVIDSAQILADKKPSPKVQSAYYFVIENILEELQPEVKKKNKKAISVYKAIADSKIKISRRLSSFRLKEYMEDSSFNPSNYARKKVKEALGSSSGSWWKLW